MLTTTDPGQRPAPKRNVVVWIMAVVAALLLVVGVAVFFAVRAVADAPTGGVRMENEMDRYALDYIREHRLLEPNERLVAYYDVTIAMDGTEAAILTTERVLYHKEGRTTAIDLADVDSIDHRDGGIIGDIIEIGSVKGARLKIEIAPMNEGESFLNALRAGWRRKRAPARGGSASP